MLSIIDEILNEFYQRNYWGYSLPNYLSAAHNAHPNYAGYLDDKPNPISTIVQVIVGGLVYVLLSAITKDEVFLEMLDKGLKMLRIRRK